MNRLKSASRTPLSTFVIVIAAAIIVAGGGSLHAYYKNRQVQVNRDIDTIEHRVEKWQLDISTTKMRSEDLLNRFAIRKQLEDSGSKLRRIPVGLPEEVNPSPPSAVASAMP
ncbi:MAG: hypothetical protein NTW21_08800 [Verrucomicrobia bacterium]|nr:hypothetical protein [Verrucomicrobiota bacterium]